MLNVDLHCHSNISDGVLAPAAVAAYARKAGVDVWALTDHDEVSGVAAARAAAAGHGMRFVAGVEISITWARETVHIVGLQIDEANPALLRGLASTRSGRDARGRDISAQLAAAGIPDAYEGALRFVGNPDLMSRTHFARYIVECGKCANIPEVFRKYLSEGKPGYVEHRWATLAEAVGWIRGAGGVAVIAHPGRYRFSDTAEGALFDEFKQLGGAAIEVVTGSHSPDQYPQYARLANDYGFLASRGTDFHAPGESRVDFAQLPPLPGNVTPVWHDWF
ncbi:MULTISPECIES: 3',5'-nucleoside bisphosphate phosphatase [unclassified Janthinobacterium]|uniref:3',5'-nucleoside bisphosphate phosphatase n=1 Tax=unclassified Janthinobacterium TaxID=2610881 RepID=UPI000347BD2B|nr:MULTISPECIES: 3',5'-nucleoside bisphosphate phosphatase [unclassified Janthinobacterium]MEC5161501.1 putative metal-dependent phosphoesterase TrpH [Janthinobacterium sp. CG_S6]